MLDAFIANHLVLNVPDITHYVNRKRQNHLHGNHIEIQAMSEMYNRPVEVTNKHCFLLEFRYIKLLL